jgi:hypothetical protein
MHLHCYYSFKSLICFRDALKHSSDRSRAGGEAKMSRIRIGGPNDRRPPPEGVSIAIKMNNSLSSDQACNI